MPRARERPGAIDDVGDGQAYRGSTQGNEPAPRKRSKIRIKSYDAIASPKHFAQLNRAVEEARLQVPIAAVYPPVQAAKAHTRLKREHVLGRIMLRIRR